MRKNIGNDAENDKKYALLLKSIRKEVSEALREISNRKSKERNSTVRYISYWFNECKPGKYFTNEYESFHRYMYYRQLRNFFIEYGYIIYTYTPIREGITIDINKKNMGFYSDKAENAIFIHSVCFEDDFRDDFENSALNVAFHELLNALSDRVFTEYDLLITCINHIDGFKEYVATAHNILRKLDDSKLPKNEIAHRYLANNKDTRCLLEAIFYKDINFQPPVVFRDIYNRLLDLLNKLEVKE